MKKVTEMLKKAGKKKIAIGGIVFLIAISIVFLVIPRPEKKTETHSEYSSIKQICELATLEGYYHDVVEFEKEAGSFSFFNHGYKKFWLEYEGVVRVGIDYSELVIGDANEEGVVEVTMPQAKVLDIDVNVDSMEEPITETGAFTTITIEDKAEAFAATQAEMRANAENDQWLLNQARNNAMDIIEQYVINAGELTGHEYTVKWKE